MRDYIISCCSTADLTEEHFKARDISYICFHFELNGKEYADDLGKSIPFDQFYAAMAAGADTKTSQVNAEEFEEYFEPFLKAGKDILHITLSSGISGVINSAMIAKENLEERYPDRRILIVDSLGASSGYGLLMDKLADLRDEGNSLDEVFRYAEKHRLNVHHWFFSTDLTFYVKGGRISKTAGAIGGVLNICPLLNMDNQGRLIPRYKIRTKRKVIRTIVDKMAEYADHQTDYNGKCYISHSGCYEDARAVADLVESRFPYLNGKVEINNVGTTIGIMDMHIRILVSTLEKGYHCTCTMCCNTVEAVENVCIYSSLFQSAFALAEALCMAHFQHITKACDHSSKRCNSLCHLFVIIEECTTGKIDLLTNCFHYYIQLIPGFL